MFNFIRRHLKDQSPHGIETSRRMIYDGMDRWSQTTLPAHLSTLRAQSLVSMFSAFDGFLRHVVDVYLSYFPQLLKHSKRNVTLPEVVNHSGDILSWLAEHELKRFDRQNWTEKRRYLTERLNLTDGGIWIHNGQELWAQIELRRHDIVHSDRSIEIEESFLTDSFAYLQRAMFLISAYSQSDHGVPFKFMEDSADVIAKRDSPKL